MWQGLCAGKLAAGQQAAGWQAGAPPGGRTPCPHGPAVLPPHAAALPWMLPCQSGLLHNAAIWLAGNYPQPGRLAQYMRFELLRLGQFK